MSRPADTLVQNIRAIALDLELCRFEQPSIEPEARFIALRAALLSRLTHALLRYESDCDEESRGEQAERDDVESMAEFR